MVKARQGILMIFDCFSTCVQGQAGQVQPESNFPPMQPADAIRYQSMFQQMDNDRDGYVQASFTPTQLGALSMYSNFSL